MPEYVTEATNALRFEETQADFYYPKSKDLVRKTIINEIVTTHSEKLVKVAFLFLAGQSYIVFSSV